MTSKLLTFTVLLALGWACNSPQAQPNATDPAESEAPDMRKYSELAGIMTSMHAYHGLLKDSVMAGAKTLPASPIDLQRIHTAEATDSRELDGNFHELASQFIRLLDSVREVKIEDRLAVYNASVATCVECHQTRCPGPIPRIKKLQIKQQAIL